MVCFKSCEMWRFVCHPRSVTCVTSLKMVIKQWDNTFVWTNKWLWVILLCKINMADQDKHVDPAPNRKAGKKTSNQLKLCPCLFCNYCKDICLAFKKPKAYNTCCLMKPMASEANSFLSRSSEMFRILKATRCYVCHPFVMCVT